MVVPSDAALATERAVRWRTLLRENGLSLVLTGLFVAFLVGQTLTAIRTGRATSPMHHGPCGATAGS